MSLDTYPLRLRDDWQNAYTGFDGQSETIEELSRQKAFDFLKAAANYTRWALSPEGIHTLRKLSSSLQSNKEYEQHWSAIHNFGQGSLHNIGNYLMHYVQKHTDASNRSIKQEAREQGYIVHHRALAPDNAQFFFEKIYKNKREMNVIDAFNSWLTGIKPQYTQTALLHSVDGIDKAMTYFQQNPKEDNGRLALLTTVKSKMLETGLTKAINNIKALVPEETPEEKAIREKHQYEIKARPL